ncbi:MAG: ABC transporter substrate-binding protein [Chloroflexota bacterium]|nr:ABC transporter substrate-binding protein [Chloroflexota bacterium]
MKRFWRSTSLLSAAALILAACGTGGTGATPTAQQAGSSTPSGSGPAAANDCGAAAFGGSKIDLSFQLQWTPQAQFAGYFAANDKGYYDEAGLTVKILDGGPTIAPQQVVAAKDGPELGEGWVPKVLVADEAGADLVNIAQVFQRSGTLDVSWKDSNIASPADWKGKKIGAWGFGNQFEMTAAASKAGLAASDYKAVTQDFNMDLLLNRDIDAAMAMTYNELAQLLEKKNPATGKLYSLDDLNILNFNDVGTAMLQDHVIARKSWLEAKTGSVSNEQIATCFLRASFRGWMYCRDNPSECVDITLNQGTILGKGHQAWMMNEINALIWPSPDGIGILDPKLWQQTIDISKEFKILKADPAAWTFRTDLAQAALDGLQGETKGTSFTKATVEVTPGGE